MALIVNALDAAIQELSTIQARPRLSKAMRSGLRFRQEQLRKAAQAAREGNDEAAQHFLWRAFDGLEQLDEDENTS